MSKEGTRKYWEELKVNCEKLEAERKKKCRVVTKNDQEKIQELWNFTAHTLVEKWENNGLWEKVKEDFNKSEFLIQNQNQFENPCLLDLYAASFLRGIFITLNWVGNNKQKVYDELKDSAKEEVK